jgi:sec-independent protein translocase protein TatB
MLPGLSFEHIIILGVIALVVVGPKDLPLLLRKMGQWTARLRAMAQEFRTGFDELARQAELDELKKEVESYAGISPPPPSPSPAENEAPSEAAGPTPAPDAHGDGEAQTPRTAAAP